MSLARGEPADIWRADLNRSRGLLLSPAERERAARFCFEPDRRRWSNARSALRRVLSGYLKLPPLSLEFGAGPHGKPFVTGHKLEFNLSHSGTWALIAVSSGPAIGVDIERIRPEVDMGKLLRRIGEPCGESAADGFRVWARREARSKAAGSPLLEAPDHDVIACDLEAPEGYAAAVAMAGSMPLPCYRGDVD